MSPGLIGPVVYVKPAVLPDVSNVISWAALVSLAMTRLTGPAPNLGGETETSSALMEAVSTIAEGGRGSFE